MAGAPGCLLAGIFLVSSVISYSAAEADALINVW